MKYYQVVYERDGGFNGKAYTFGFDGELAIGTIVDLPHGHGIVVGVTTKDILESLHEPSIKTITKISERSKDGAEKEE